MAFVAPTVMHGYHDATDAFLDGSQHRYQAEANAPMQNPPKPAYYSAAMPPQISCDIKPRLTKDQHDFLEEQFMKQNKPNTNTKRAFAEQLHVSLDKVNNWFQNRRAKSKQDAKKAGAFANASYGSNANFSDSDTSPAFVSPQYSLMMHQFAPEQQTSHPLPLVHLQHMQEQAHLQNMHYSEVLGEHFANGNLAVPYSMPDMFDSPQEMNRRTLTQEQFNALAQNGGVMAQPAHYQSLQHDFSNETDAVQQVFPNLEHADFKDDDDVFAFSTSYGTSLSSHDSSAPSATSDQSIFPANPLTEQSSISTSPEDWVDSHHPSLSASVTSEHPAQYPQMSSAPQQNSTATTQWQPGQSKPVDVSALQKQFQEAQAQSQVAQQQPHQPLAEQTFTHLDDDSLGRRDSENSTMLTQQMSEFALQTPLQQQGHFKPPGIPPSSIAARRQARRPAQLGIAALRSVSYSGGPQTSSPSAKPSQQPLRRIQSSVGLNGVAQGRVMKGSVAPAQRSPLSFAFAESIGSPKALRHASMSSNGASSLAPPTPLSPREISGAEQFQSHFSSQWPSSGPVSRQTSINETEAEHNVVNFMPAASVPPQQNFSSPPHTPMYQHHHQQSFPGHPNPSMILENTPPQSAPACQQSFSANAFMISHQPTSMPPPPLPQMQHAQQMPIPEQQQMINVCMPEQQYQAPMLPLQPGQPIMVPMAGPTAEMHMQPMHFAPDGAVIDRQGMMAMVPVSAQSQPMQFLPYALPPGHAQTQQQHIPTPPHYSFVTAAGSPSGMLAHAQLPKHSTVAQELFVHEYSPPNDIKQSVTPRSKGGVDSGPKAYTFANQGPEHFEKDKSKKGSVTSSSPESSASSN